MKIPTSFELGGIVWKVRMMKRLKGRYGDCNLKNQTIQILSTAPQQIQEWTFCHELGHAIKFAQGIDQEQHVEQDIDAFATFLHQFMNTAVYKE